MGGKNDKKNVGNIAGLGGAVEHVLGKRGTIFKERGEAIFEGDNFLEMFNPVKGVKLGLLGLEQGTKIVTDALGYTDPRKDLADARGEEYDPEDLISTPEDIREAPSSAVSRFAQFQLRRKGKLGDDEAGREGLTIKRDTELGIQK